MAFMRFEAITAKIPRIKLMRRIIEIAVLEEVQVAQRELGQFFMTWDGKPDVNVKVETIGDRIVGAAYLAGDEGILDIVKWVVYGTSRHDITPRGEGYPLRFPETFTPRTQPGVIQSVPGGKDWGGEWTVAYQVDHPGNEPRDTFRVIADNRRKFFRLKMVRAVARGLARAVRSGVKR